MSVQSKQSLLIIFSFFIIYLHTGDREKLSTTNHLSVNETEQRTECRLLKA